MGTNGLIRTSVLSIIMSTKLHAIKRSKMIFRGANDLVDIFLHDELHKKIISISHLILLLINNPANIYSFKGNNRNIRKRCEICSTETPELLTLNIFHTSF